MSWTPPIATEADLKSMFPLSNAAPAADVFELGLVLGGTVSSGAFTAGVLDYLIEALDCWDVQVDLNDPVAPTNRVVLKVIGGTSRGSVCAAILGRLLHYAFPPYKRTNPKYRHQKSIL